MQVAFISRQPREADCRLGGELYFNLSGIIVDMRSIRFSWRNRIKTSLIFSVYSVCTPITNFAIAAIVIRLSAAELWNETAKCLVLITILTQIVSWNNKDYLLREFSMRNKVAQYWKSSFVTRLLLLLVCAPLVFFFSTGTNPWLMILLLAGNFIYRSFDSLITFGRKFTQATIIEVVCNGFVLASVASVHRTIDTIVICLVLGTLLKAILFAVLFRSTLLAGADAGFNSRQLVAAFPFFVTSMVNTLGARADVFAMATVKQAELGRYYLLVNLLSYCYMLATMVTEPYIKNFYRMAGNPMQNVKRLFFIGGLVWTFAYAVGIRFMMVYVYHLDFPEYTYLLIWAILVPYFLYYLSIYELTRLNKTYQLMTISIVSAGMYYVLSLLLIKQFGYTGGLAASLVVQWLLLAAFSYQTSKYLKTQIDGAVS